MKVSRFAPDVRAEHIRALGPPAGTVAGDVAAILEEVRTGGDAALARLTARFDRAEVAPERLRVDPREIAAAERLLEGRLATALRTAMTNVGLVARSQVRQSTPMELGQGQRVEIAELPVRRAAAYVPGGRAPYPSTLVMCAVTMREAGVEQIVVCAPPGPRGDIDPVILGTCAMAGVTEVYRMGGAQAVGALAYGTETIAPVDVIVGPGNRYVTEAKRQVFGTVGIDGLAGPSELVVVASRGADPELIALDVLAQAEHGPDSLVAVLSPDGPLLQAVERAVAVRERPSPAGGAASTRVPAPVTVRDVPLALAQVYDVRSAVALAEALAPEHLQLMGAEAEALSGRVRSAGCLFVGRDAATAFGDYVAGSNHVLPTGGAARFASGLGVATFRRRMARVSLPPGAAKRLAPAGATLAAAEGFTMHAESMARRA